MTPPTADQSHMGAAAALALDSLQGRAGAQRTLDDWIHGARGLALLSVAISSGVLALLRTPRTIAELATTSALPPGYTEDLCHALEAYGVVVRNGLLYCLSAEFRLLAAGGGAQSLEDMLGGELVRLRSVALVTPGRVRTRPLSGAAQLAVARAQGPPPMPLTITGARDLADAIPEVSDLWQSGGSHIELGCGTAGALLALLIAFPSMRAVGVDRSSRVLMAARRRASVAGVARRVQWRRSDARTLREVAAFDTAFWSQPFFSANTRCTLLAVCWRILRPGGYVLIPVLEAAPRTAGLLETPAGRAAAFERVAFGVWDASPLSPAQLITETEAAGFTVEQLVPSVFGRLVVARKPRAA